MKVAFGWDANANLSVWEPPSAPELVSDTVTEPLRVLVEMLLLPFGHVWLEGEGSTMADYLSARTMEPSYELTLSRHAGMWLPCQEGMLCGEYKIGQKWSGWGTYWTSFAGNFRTYSIWWKKIVSRSKKRQTGDSLKNCSKMYLIKCSLWCVWT